jgi:hypothetical protein
MGSQLLFTKHVCQREGAEATTCCAKLNFALFSRPVWTTSLDSTCAALEERFIALMDRLQQQ